MIDSILSFWNLPILFIIHDLEEIIFVPKFVKDNKSYFEKYKSNLYGGAKNSNIFAIGVSEEFSILLIVSIICMIHKNYYLYVSFLLIYTLHFFKHFLISIKFKKYSPGLITVFLELPILIYLIIFYSKFISSNFIFLFYFIPSIIIMILNLNLVHKFISLD